MLGELLTTESGIAGGFDEGNALGFRELATIAGARNCEVVDEVGEAHGTL